MNWTCCVLLATIAGFSRATASLFLNDNRQTCFRDGKTLRPRPLRRRNRPPKTGAFRKRSWKQMNLELYVLVWMENSLETELLENDDVTIITWFVCPSLPQTQIQNGGRNGDCHVNFATWVKIKPCYAHAHGWTQAVSAACDCWVFKFLLRSVDGKHFIRFLVWTKNIWCVFRVIQLRFQIPPASCGRDLKIALWPVKT